MRTLILLHGFPFDHKLWNHVVPLLPKTLQILAPDLRGVNRALSTGVQPSIDIMADDIATLMDHRGIEQAYVAGMSMGGYVALAFAQRYRHRLAGIALVNSHAWADTPEARESRYKLIAEMNQKGVEAVLNAMLPRLFSERNPAWDAFAVQAASHAGIEGLAWQLEAMASRPERVDLLGTLALPALVIHGEEDRIVSLERSKDMVKCLPFGQLTVIPGAGHGTPIEAPSAVAEALRAWRGRGGSTLV